jgi:solute carrier family 23 (nucleobase transporter), member 1
MVDADEDDHEDDEGADTTGDFVYGLHDRPPLWRSVVYATQHIFAMILGSIIGGFVIAEAVGLDDLQTGRLIGYINLAMGIATILQVRVGIRLPVIQGSTMGHVPAYLTLGALGATMFDDAETTMQYLMGALIVGAIFEAVFGFANGLRWVYRFMSPLAVGMFIMMIGLGLWPVINDFIGDAWHYAMIVIAIVLIGRFALGRTAQTMALFGAVLIAYAVAAAASATGLIGAGHALHVDFEVLASAGVINMPELFPWGTPRFHAGFILAMLIPYVATAFESLGDYLALARMTKAEDIDSKRLSRGLGVEGSASVLSAVIGGTATSSFSQNVGVIRLSGVASLFVNLVAGVLLVLIGLFAYAGTALASIPEVILGAVYIVAFGILVITGLRLVLEADITSPRNEVIIGTALLIGLAVPAYMEDVDLEFGIAALEVFANTFLATPMMVAGAWVLLLDNLIPGTDEERGLTAWSEFFEQR